MVLGESIGPDPKSIALGSNSGSNLGFDAVQLRSTVLLERAWEELKKLESNYLRTPFFKGVYGEELGILPGIALLRRRKRA